MRLLPSVYLTVTGVPTPRQRFRTGLLYGGPGAVLAGATAVGQYGLTPTLDRRVHVLLPHASRPASNRLVVVRRTTRPITPTWRDGLPLCPLPRALLDACHPMSDLREVRALLAAAVQQRLTSVDDLAIELLARESSGSRLSREVLSEVAAGVRSVTEAELRTLLNSSPVLPPALWNCQLGYRGEWLADPDAYYADAGLVVESDSLGWHSSPEDREETEARHARMEAVGLHVVHVMPRRHRRGPRTVLREIEGAYLAAKRAGPPPGVTVLALAR